MKILPALMLILAAADANAAANFAFRSGPQRVALVELFTSEGCNSCPPAEKWLSGLRGRDSLWTKFVPVAFHVDYWDNLGWKDRFSNPSFTQRQNDYIRFWREDTMYTPSVVVDGRTWSGWRDSAAPPNAIADRPGVLEIASRGTNWIVTFSPSVAGSWRFNATLLACGVDVEVKAGENAGRTLRHDFAALTITNGALSSRDHPTAEFSFAPLKTLPKQIAIAVWITRGNSPAPVQAVGGFLSGPAD